VIDGRTVFPVLLAFLGTGCASTIAAHRPLSDAGVAEVNESIAGSQASVVLAEEPGRAVEREPQEAAREACRSAPGQGSVRFGKRCDDTRDCECGLTCQVDRCLGRSLKSRTIPSLAPPKSLDAREVKVGRDTTQWLELRSGTGDERRQSTVPTAALKSISVRRRGRGALEGLGLGLVLGVTVGAAVGGLWGAVGESHVSPECGCPLTAAGLVYGAAFGAILGPLLGTAIGAGIGHRTTVEFDPP
jgi:hypothetical protein